MAKKKICIVGGGASGLALMWALTRNADANEVTLLHDEERLGGHSKTVFVTIDGKTYPVDLGVQFICHLLYPNTNAMIRLPEFAPLVPLAEHDSLKISCAFKYGQWGNFPDYQEQPRFSLYSDQAKKAAERFTKDIFDFTITGRGSITVAKYLQTHGAELGDDYVNNFLLPYLNITNGYGTQGLEQVTFQDLFPLFEKVPGFLAPSSPLGSFTVPGTGWQRFERGASSWIDAMARFAKQNGGIINQHPDTPLANPGDTYDPCRVTAVYPDQTGTGAWVEWTRTHQGTPVTEKAKFDDVVITTEMMTARQLLQNPQNFQYPKQIRYISAQRFPLMRGACYVHQDESILSPNLRDQKETLQFTAYYADNFADELPYDMSKTYTSYILKDFTTGMPADTKAYVTMYGYVPPNPPKQLLAPPVYWWHGRWSASYFSDAKKSLHEIQGLGNIWFAGNNTTTDSEEGALVSGLVIAKHLDRTFKWHKWLEPSLWGRFMYDQFEDVMFPQMRAGERLARLLHGDLFGALPSR